MVGIFGCEEGCLGMAGEVVEVGIDIAAATQILVKFYGRIEVGFLLVEPYFPSLAYNATETHSPVPVASCLAF